MTFYDATNPRARDYIWAKVRENYFELRHQDLVARRLRARAEARRTRRTSATTPARAPRSATSTRCCTPAASTRACGPRARRRSVSLCRSAWAGSQRYGAPWSGPATSTPTFEDLRAPDRRRPQHRAVRHPVVDDGHRRLQGRRHQRPVVPRADRPLVPVRRVLPGVPAARHPRAGHHARRRADRRPPTRSGRSVTSSTRSSGRLLFLRERLRPYVHGADAGGARVRPAADAPAVRGLPGRPGELGGRGPVPLRRRPAGRAGLHRGSPGTRGSTCPRGATWRDAWTGAEHRGRPWVTAPAPLDAIPVFLRADGTVEPFGAFADLASAAPSASPVDSSTADGRSGE